MTGQDRAIPRMFFIKVLFWMIAVHKCAHYKMSFKRWMLQNAISPLGSVTIFLGSNLPTPDVVDRFC